jgi:hypothetical protein
VKFLVISRPKGKLDRTLTPAEADGLRERLLGYMKQGVVERAYVILGGGTVHVINAETSDDLMRALRRHEISRVGDIEVQVVEDAVAFLEAYANEVEARRSP